MITPEEIAENQRKADRQAAVDHAEYEHTRALAGIEMVLPRSGEKPPTETDTEAPVVLEFGPDKAPPVESKKVPAAGKKKRHRTGE